MWAKKSEARQPPLIKKPGTPYSQMRAFTEKSRKPDFLGNHICHNSAEEIFAVYIETSTERSEAKEEGTQITDITGTIETEKDSLPFTGYANKTTNEVFIDASSAFKTGERKIKWKRQYYFGVPAKFPKPTHILTKAEGFYLETGHETSKRIQVSALTDLGKLLLNKEQGIDTADNKAKDADSNSINDENRA